MAGRNEDSLTYMKSTADTLHSILAFNCHISYRASEAFE